MRHLHCDAGICVTASHNPAKYNGYKAYGNDGCQVTEGMADCIMAEIEALDIFADVKKIPFEEALASGKAEYIGEETVNAFIDAVYGVSSSSSTPRSTAAAKCACCASSTASA